VNTIAIARFTFQEARRRRLLWLGIGLGLAFLALFGVGFYFVFDDIRRSVIMDFVGSDEQEAMLGLVANLFLMMGMFVVNFLVVLVAILTTVGAISGEISSHTIQAIVTKPLRRSEIILGKWLGHALMVTFYIIMLTGGIILIVKVISGHSPNHLAEGLGLYVLEGLVLMSVSILGGTRLSTMANGVLVFMIYGLAFVGGWVEQIASLPFVNSDTAVTIGSLAGKLLPSEVLWRRASHVMAPSISLGTDFEGPPPFLFTFGREPSSSVVLYALVYIVVILVLAFVSFQRRDL
jgi:ABC-type transport system involved in multi-copper enzyme maturation permease subunit